MRKKKKGNYSLDVMMPSYFLSVLWSMASGLTPAVPNPSRTSSPKDVLRAHFHRKMQNKSVPLLADFDTYETTLPVRRDIESGEDVRLCEFPYWVIDKDLERMANDLERRHPVEPLSSTLPLLDRPARP